MALPGHGLGASSFDKVSASGRVLPWAKLPAGPLRLSIGYLQHLWLEKDPRETTKDVHKSIQGITEDDEPAELGLGLASKET